jgi:hypothetical protein
MLQGASVAEWSRSLTSDLKPNITDVSVWPDVHLKHLSIQTSTHSWCFTSSVYYICPSYSHPESLVFKIKLKQIAESDIKTAMTITLFHATLPVRVIICMCIRKNIYD